MNRLTKLTQDIDAFQRRHTITGFVYAIIKKYSQDNCGYQSAVITYYGFLSLFPLLVVLTSLVKLLLKNNSSLREKIINNTVHYFPIVGNQLQNSIHSPKETGFALIISLIIMLYGARGVANALQYSLSSLWYIPQFKMPSFIKSLLRSLGIIVVGGVGLLIASIVSGYAAIPGNALFIKLITTAGSLLLLWLTFIFIFKLAIARRKTIRQVLVGSAITAIGLQILQTLGYFIMVHELKGLSSIYGTFALVVSLLFWIYLQTEVLLYAAEIDVIRAYHLFPRSLVGHLTKGDKAAYHKQAESKSQSVNEKIVINFQK
jgi:YihY family inner membrane protein